MRTFCCLALALCLALPAFAEPMPNLTLETKVSAANRETPSANAMDGKRSTIFKFGKNTQLILTPPQPVYGLYLEWEAPPGAWKIIQEHGSTWEVKVTGGDDGLYHSFTELPGLEGAFRLQSADDALLPALAEVTLLGAGDVPEWVQRWVLPPEKVDLMMISTHCDDELVFFGGVLPVYAGVQQRDTLVVYMAVGLNVRRHEALDGLWACGVTQQPVFGTFRDHRSETLAEAYSKWGKAKPRAFLTGLMRQYQPDVIVSHDVKGEYGHGAHRLVADVAQYIVKNGQDPSLDPESYALYGGFQPYKLYLHLYKEGRIELDFDMPLERFSGRTAREVADDAFAYHVSQKAIPYRASSRGKYDCALWGLVFTRVGADVHGNSLFEHVPTGAFAFIDGVLTPTTDIF